MASNKNTHGGARKGAGRPSFAARHTQPYKPGTFIPGTPGRPSNFFAPRRSSNTSGNSVVNDTDQSNAAQNAESSKSQLRHSVTSEKPSFDAEQGQ